MHHLHMGVNRIVGKVNSEPRQHGITPGRWQVEQDAFDSDLAVALYQRGTDPELAAVLHQPLVTGVGDCVVPPRAKEIFGSVFTMPTTPGLCRAR